LRSTNVCFIQQVSVLALDFDNATGVLEQKVSLLLTLHGTDGAQ
jgi:hypothetical protein